MMIMVGGVNSAQNKEIQDHNALDGGEDEHNILM